MLRKIKKVMSGIYSKKMSCDDCKNGQYILTERKRYIEGEDKWIAKTYVCQNCGSSKYVYYLDDPNITS